MNPGFALVAIGLTTGVLNYVLVENELRKVGRMSGSSSAVFLTTIGALSVPLLPIIYSELAFWSAAHLTGVGFCYFLNHSNRK